MLKVHLCLSIILRIKIQVVHDNRVSGGEINSKAARLRGQEEDRNCAILMTKLIYQLLAILSRCELFGIKCL